MDAVCAPDEEWRVILYKENNRIRAAFPFAYMKGKHSFWRIHNPWQAARLGIWIDYRGKPEKAGTRELYENKIVEEIVGHLPYFDEFNIAFDARFQNWQQFYRMGFQQTSHYSYTLENGTDVLQTLSSKTRNQYRALEQEYHVTENIGIEEFWAFFEKSFQQRGRLISYSKEQFFRLYEAVQNHGCCHLIACRDSGGQVFAVVYTISDSRRLYTMFNTFDTTPKRSPLPLATLRAIDLANQEGLSFDFEGSMIPGVANYDVKFHGVKEPYFVISNHSDKYRFFNGLRESARALKNIVKG